MTLEHRSLVEPIEFRANGTHITASGVAMKYGAASKPIYHKQRGLFREVFSPGSFAKTITEQDIRSHNEHGGPYLGRSGAGTLRLVDTRSELAYELDLPDTTAGRDAAALLERGDIKGSSIGFAALRSQEKWSVGEDGMTLRSIAAARLAFIDLTVAPAYDDSTAELALRSLAEDKDMELRSLLELADRGELPTLLASPDGEDDEERRSDPDGRETPTVVRAPLSHLMY